MGNAENAGNAVSQLSPLKRALLALDDMKAKLDASERSRTEPIAIVGMGCRFPGGSHGPDAFWRFLREGGNGVTDVPADRWNADAYFDPDPGVPGKAYGRWGAFLDGIDCFDPQFFGIAPREAAGIDPQQRLLLETTWEALEDAGTSPERLSGVTAGVFVGINSIDYATLQLQQCDLASIDAYSLSGSAHSIAAGRLAYVLGLQGPALAVDTACSSSLVAVHLACQSLRNDDCRVAVAGGVHVTLTPINSVVFSKLRMLAADGRCKTFDARGDGFVEGEGCAVIVLKRLADALADGDRILALVRGSAVNQDGASSGLTAPNGPSQETVIRAALERAGVTPSDVGYIEAHGTGTSLGDPIEVQALASVLGEGRPADRPLVIGSVKTNIGHTQAAAGIAGLVKLVLALQHREIPPNLHFEQPNPYIPWATIPVTVARALVPWERGESPRVGGVSSFGFSGTNVHIVVGEAPDRTTERPAADRPLHLVTLSARSEAALQRLAARWGERLDTGASALDLRDVAFTANAGRAHLAERAAMISGTLDELRGQLAGLAAGNAASRTVRMRVTSGDRPRIAFLFTGQGAQYVGMGRELYETQPTFRAALDRCEAILRGELDRSLLSVLYPESGAASPIDDTAYTQPALFALEYALAEVWRSWGIVPSAVMGHSIGEYVAATIAGVFSLEDALALVAARGRLMQALPAGGGMAAVFTSEAAVRGALGNANDGVAIAAVNSPEDVVISGPAAGISAVIARLEAAGVRSERLTVSHAFHSALMDPILDEFEKAAAAVKFSVPRMTLVSNVTGAPIKAEIATPAYWRRHLREAVRFGDGVSALCALGYRLFLEVGPRPTLSGLARRTVSDGVFLPSLRKAGADWVRMLESLADLYGRGTAIDWAGFDRGYVRRKLSMPTYAFERERHWLPDLRAEAGTGGEGRPAKRREGKAVHPLLGARLSSALKDLQYESELSVQAPAFLADHRKRGATVFPATAFLDMGLSAARDALGAGSHVFEELVINEPLLLGPDPVRVQTVLSPDGSGAATFQLFSRAADDESGRERWRLHGMGTLRTAPSSGDAQSEPLDRLQARCTERVPLEPYYDELLADGHEYGPAFRGVTNLWRGEWEALASLDLPAAIAAEAREYRIHPVLLDASMQILAAAVPAQLKDRAKGETYLPVSLGRVRVYRDGAHGGWSHARVRVPAGGETDGFSADVRIYDTEGRLVAEVQDVYHKRISADAIEANARKTMASWLHEVAWAAQSVAAESKVPDERRGAWVLLAGSPGGHAAGLAAALAAKDMAPIVVISGPAYEASNGSVVIDPENAEHYARLLHDAATIAGQPLRGIVHAWTGSGNGSGDLAAIDAQVRAGCGSLMRLVQAMAGANLAPRPSLSVITCGATGAGDAQGDVRVEQAPLWSLARSIAVEHPDLRCRSIDLDPARPADGLDDVAADLLAGGAEDRVAYRSGRRYVARLVRSALARAVAGGDPSDRRPVSLEIAERGVLDRLELQPVARRQPGEGEIEIQVAAAGLNFRDVLNALGVYEGEPGPLGSECAGRVVSVGPGVTHLTVGDDVLGMAPASFRSYVTAPAGPFVVKPRSLSIEEAATIPVAFLTADFALNRLARLARGERVLIHAAAGGVGLAAIQLAQRAGAEIYATAGSPEKHAYLRSLGVEHIMSSRSLGFADRILELTGGTGVDVVLNSLAGEFVGKSVSVLRRGGRFLEIGKAGIWTPEQMASARPDVEYFPIYFRPDDHALIQEMLGTLMEGFASGALRPLRHQVFPIADATDAFRFMAQAKHIGKIVLRLGELPQTGGTGLAADASYLITGGLGALGLSVARWMVGAGARHVALLARHEPAPEIAATIDALRQTGADVVCLQGDVSREDDVVRVLAEIEVRMPPVRGIVHAAGVLDDGLLLQQTWPRFETVLAPKVAGAWNLHRRTAGLDLDFFVMFSSMVALFGGSGQSNYAAANGFLDGLAAHRRASGLPALSIAWGPWAGEGMAARVSDRDRQRWREQGYGSIAPEDGVAVLEQLLRHAAPPRVAVLPIDWPALFRQFAAGSEPPILADLAKGYVKRPKAAAAARRRLVQEIGAVAPGRRRALVGSFLREEALKVLGLDAATDIDPRQPLSEFGLDSLMAVELRNAIAAALERTLPATLLFKHPTLEALGGFVMDLIAADAPAAKTAEAPAADGAAALAPLTDEETRQLLSEELQSLAAWTTGE